MSMLFLRYWCFFMGFFVLSIGSFGQNRILRGKVLDEIGHPVPYASITFKGYSYGTITDKDGNYQAIISEKFDSNVCTHVNYERKAEKVEGNSTINFLLEKRAISPINVIIVETVGTKEIEREVFNSKVEVGDKYFEKVEIWAAFPGGEKALTEYLNEKVANEISKTFPSFKGVVKVGFTVSKEGVAIDINIIKGISQDIDDFIRSVVSGMPKWNPAIQNGRPAEQYKEISFSFDLTAKEH